MVHRLEEKYSGQLIVVGIHAGKFIAERVTENIQMATRRLGITHPVANDRQFRTWKAYGVQAWPTVVLISPDGHYIGQHSGEFSFEQFDAVVAAITGTYRQEGLLTSGPLPFSAAPGPVETSASPLYFPGKVLADAEGGRLFIADTAHNRLLVASMEESGRAARVTGVIGSSVAGFSDGPFPEAMLDHPHGMALQGDSLFIADTENHSIRAAHLQSGTLETIAGTGEIGYGRAGGVGRDVKLNSPWDLLESDNYLYIAMAGTHQIWRMTLSNGRVEPFVGSGRENIDDGPNPRATLAQPSGLTTDEQRLFFADSESSAVRAADFSPDGYTQTLIGTGLFDFGDKDGKGLEARLEHCLGVAYHEGAIYIADTYNNKIKRLDLETREVRSVLGSGLPADMYEPGGLAVWADPARPRLLIADTNNHRILSAAIAPDGSLDEAVPLELLI